MEEDGLCCLHLYGLVKALLQDRTVPLWFSFDVSAGILFSKILVHSSSCLCLRRNSISEYNLIPIHFHFQQETVLTKIICLCFTILFLCMGTMISLQHYFLNTLKNIYIKKNKCIYSGSYTVGTLYKHLIKSSKPLSKFTVSC